jgi:hypothetical protein
MTCVSSIFCVLATWTVSGRVALAGVSMDDVS